MSLAAIRNGLWYTLTACGPFGRNEVSACDFGIVENVAGCAIVFLPGTTKIDRQTYGNVFQRNWGINGLGFIKDTGDSGSTLSRVWQFHDDLYNTVIKDQSLGGAVQAAYLTGFNFNVNSSIDFGGGPIFFMVEWSMTAEEF